MVGDEQAYIDWFAVPHRGKGGGRTQYEAWEAALPATVKLVRLHAVDAGHGDSSGFWKAMGFDFRWTWDPYGPEPHLEAQQEMIKILRPGSGWPSEPTDFWETE